MPETSPPTSRRSDYRPDIDGLRAIAVLSVLAYHYGISLPGGFTGVDVFFVISGFLITVKLTEDIAGGVFSILGFYDRRVRRILPALLVVLLVTLVAGNFLLMPGDYKSLAASAAAAAFGVSNFFFQVSTGYFDQASDLLPLIHTWSLAVEEQFYLAWPVLLLFAVRGRSRSQTAALLGIITIAGFAASLAWFGSDPKAAFYVVVPRAWELSLGAVLVFLPPLGLIVGELAAVLGIALIATGFAVVSAHSFPGPAALYPCFGAAFIIWPRKVATATAAWLGYLSPVGLISYSLYLWHWPVWVLFRIYINNQVPNATETAVLTATSIALAVLSYVVVERPFRRRRWLPVRSVSVGLLACLTIAIGGAVIYQQDGRPGRMSRDLYAMRSLDAMWEWPCQISAVADGVPPLCTFGAPWVDGTDKAVLWGDSNAEHLAPFLQDSAKATKIAVALYPPYPCAAIMNGETVLFDKPPFVEYNDQCGKNRATMLDLLAKHRDIKTVVLSALWQPLMLHLEGARQLKGESQKKLLELSLGDTIERISTPGRRIVIVAAVPQWDHDPIPCARLSIGLWRRPCADHERFLFKAAHEQMQADYLDIFQRLAVKHSDVSVVVPGDGLCKADTCITELNGEFLYRDAHHFRRNLNQVTNVELSSVTKLDQIFSAREAKGRPAER